MNPLDQSYEDEQRKGDLLMNHPMSEEETLETSDMLMTMLNSVGFSLEKEKIDFLASKLDEKAESELNTTIAHILDRIEKANHPSVSIMLNGDYQDLGPNVVPDSHFVERELAAIRNEYGIKE